MEIHMSKIQRGEIRNPLGRPRNTGHRQQVFNTLVLPHKEALFTKAIDLALNGNEAMLRLFIERMIPAKPTDEPINLNVPEALNFDASATMVKDVLQQLSTKELTPQQAQSVMVLIKFFHDHIGAKELLDAYQKLSTDLNKLNRG
jgi:hypothetical protein